MGKNKNKNRSNIVFDLDEKNDKKQDSTNLDNDDFQPVKKGARINIFQMLKQDESDEEKINLTDKIEEIQQNHKPKILIDYEQNNKTWEPENYSKEEKKELFKLAYEEDVKGDHNNAIKYYEILCKCSHRVSYHNLANIYWERNNIELALDLFEKGIKLKYLNSLYDYTVLVLENLNILSKYRKKALEYFQIYMLLKNATPEERNIYFDLIHYD